MTKTIAVSSHQIVSSTPEKVRPIGLDKFFEVGNDSLRVWAGKYFTIMTKGSSPKTEKAKMEDLAKFLSFFQETCNTDHMDAWAPAVTKQFQRDLQNTVSRFTGRGYAPTSINRIMATFRHLDRWVHKQRLLLAEKSHLRGQITFNNINNLMEEGISVWRGTSSFGIY